MEQKKGQKNKEMAFIAVKQILQRLFFFLSLLSLGVI